MGPGQPVLVSRRARLFPTCLLRTHSVYAQENRGAAEPVGGGTLSQQSQPPQQPANTAPCTMLMGDVRQPDALSTDSTLYAKSTISYSQMNDAPTPDGETSATTAQEASSVVGMPSLNVVGPIPSDVVVDPTSTFPGIPGPTWGPSNVIPANNDASQDWSTPPTTPLYPTTTMVTMPTVWTEMGCIQKRTTGSRLRRQAGNNISCDPAGPSPEPHSPPPESSCSSTSATRTSNSPAASTSSPASSDPIPPFPPLLKWIQFAIITITGVGAWVYWVRRNLCQWSESSLEPCTGESALSPGGGRTRESEAPAFSGVLEESGNTVWFALWKKKPGGR